MAQKRWTKTIGIHTSLQPLWEESSQASLTNFGYDLEKKTTATKHPNHTKEKPKQKTPTSQNKKHKKPQTK